MRKAKFYGNFVFKFGKDFILFLTPTSAHLFPATRWSATPRREFNLIKYTRESS
jgi:hypothetical protein